MRLLGQLLGLLVAIAAAVWGYAYWDSVRPREIAGAADERVTGATRVLAYALPARGWLTFPIEPGGEKTFRLLTNANVTPAAALDPEALLEYTLEYELLDADGVVLDTVHHILRTLVSHFEDPELPGAIRYGAFYLNGDRVPADGRIVLVNFSEQPDAKRIRVRLAQAGIPIESVIVRAYQRERLPDYKLANRWERLGTDRRSRLARGNVYDQQFLTQEEKLALVRYRWNPAAPLGVPAVDFEQRMLYLRNEGEQDPIREPVIPYGLIVDAETNGTVSLPGWPNGVNFEFEPVAADARLRAEIRWRGDRSGRADTTEVDLDGVPSSVSRRYGEPGLAEISSDGAVAVRVFAGAPDGSEVDLTPRPAYLRAYLVAPGQPVDYALTHGAGDYTPLRVDVRALLAVGETQQAHVLRAELLSADGEPVENLRCQLALAATRYDRAQTPEGDTRRPSEAGSCYIAVPASVSHVRLQTDRELMVAAYVRPSGLIKEVEVPNDYLSFQRDRVRSPTWFYLRPSDHTLLARAGRGIQLVTQRRPKDEDDDVLAGRYRWDEFRPVGNWTARYVLNPRDSQLPLRDRALTVVYHPVAAGRGHELEFRAGPGARSLEPRVLFVKPDAAAMAVSVSIDGRAVLRQRVRGTRGELRLPALAAGVHALKIEADRVAQWYVNHVRAGGDARVRRLAVRVHDGEMRFRYDKRLPVEVLTGRLQVPSGMTAPTRLRVDITARRSRASLLSSEWSVLKRRYVIHPDNSGAAPVFGGGGGQLDLGQRFYIPLNSDLPQGDYDITLWPENVSTAYLTLYRLTPGLYNDAKLLRERKLHDADN